MTPPRREPDNISRVLLSGRLTPRIDALYALIITDEFGVENIVRRTTADGPIPLLTDDLRLVEKLLELAKSTAPEAHVEIGTFVRARDYRTLQRQDP